MNDLKDIPVHHQHREMLAVWFFIGVLLLIYGVIILFIGIRDYHHPASVVLSKYHGNLWAGGILLSLGSVYTIAYRPKKRSR